MLKFSKRVQPGHVVMKHGEKFVRCNSGKRIFGVVQAGYTQRILTDNGLVTVEVPAGVVTYGPVMAFHK